MAISTGYYNYYNNPHRYFTQEPLTAWYYKEVDTEAIHNNNSNNRDSNEAAEFRKLSEVYSSIAESNRSKYSTEDEAITAIFAKYIPAGNGYNEYSLEERTAMYRNELEMTLYGKVATAANDPRLAGEVSENKGTKVGYNDSIVNMQFNNVLSNAGISLSSLVNQKFSLSIDPYTYKLTISGLENEELTSKMETALNTGNNSRQLFYYLLNKEKEVGSISDTEKNKYLLMKDFQSITGEDIRDYELTEDGFYREDGKSAEDVYKEALKTSNMVPSEFKGAAFEYFKSLIEKAKTYDFASTMDLILGTDYMNGMLSAAQNGIFMYSGSGDTNDGISYSSTLDFKA